MELTNNHLFGILLSVAVFYGGVTLRNKLKLNFINPLLLGIIIIIGLLVIADIPFEHYMKGGSVIHAFLGPVTVLLALPLYRQRKLLVEYKYPIIFGILTGVITSLVSVILLSRVFDLNEILERSLLAHSVTTPIGISISNSLGAIEGITVVSIVITGILGTAIAPIFYKLLRIMHPVAKGLGLGTTSHALGTTKAFEMGETEGAVSSLAIGVAALTTVAIVTVLKVVGFY